MTIYDLKVLNLRAGGFFFTRNNMKFAKDTMKSFSFKDHKNGTATVTRKRDGTKWTFDTNTGLVTHAQVHVSVPTFKLNA